MYAGTQGRTLEKIVVVGANLAGLRALETLRREGFDGSIVLINGECELPYDRPPLSKKVLTGDILADNTIYRGQEYYDSLSIDVRSGQRATSLDLRERTVKVGREAICFDGLIIATGASPRTLPECNSLQGVYVVRTIDDAKSIRAAFKGNPKVVVAGAGFIGSEVAASARALGLEVTVLEKEPAPLCRAVGAEMGHAISALHQDNGTHLRCGAVIDAFEGHRRVERLRLKDGNSIDADIVIVGIGVTPNVEWLVQSGLALSNGLVCDVTLNAGHPAVYGAGDVVRWPNPLFDLEMRCEQWTNAAEQGRHAACNLLANRGATRPYAGSCYFWSDQYGVKIQFAGIASAEEIRVVKGSIDSHKFVAFYRKGDRIVGVLGLDFPKLVMKAKMMIEQRVLWQDALATIAAL